MTKQKICVSCRQRLASYFKMYFDLMYHKQQIMDGHIKQKNIFEPTWPSEYYELIRNEIAISIHDEKFVSFVDDGNEISTETVFEKLRLASDAFDELSDRESRSGDHYFVAGFYKNMSEGFKRLSNDCIFKLNKDSVLKINNLVEIVIERIKIQSVT